MILVAIVVALLVYLFIVCLPDRTQVRDRWVGGVADANPVTFKPGPTPEAGPGQCAPALPHAHSVQSIVFTADGGSRPWGGWVVERLAG